MEKNNKTTRNTDALVDARAAMEAYVAGFTPNATFPKAPDAKAFMALDAVKAFVHAIATGQRYYLVGKAGTGKTSFIKAISKAFDVDCVYINAANMSVENLGVPFPKYSQELNMEVLETLFYENLANDRPKIVFIDEIGRADAGMGNSLMTLVHEGLLFGKPIPGLRTVIAADNPQGSAYGKMAGLDFSQADRMATVVLDSKSTPWRYALAEEFFDVDLSKVFSTYDTLDAEVRETLSPRVLAFLIRGLLAGFPGVYALPMPSGVRQALVNRNGEDVTKVVLDKMATALGTVNRDSIPDKVERVVAFALENSQNVYIQGRPGVGKTGYIRNLLDAKGIVSHYDSAPVLQPEDLAVPFPSADGTTLRIVPQVKFSEPSPWVWIVDEIARGSRRTQNAIMEPIQERTIGGQPTRLKCTIALNNPREVAGMKLDVGKSDLAQASRFALSIEIDAADIPSASYLREMYGDEIASPFVEWWEDDLDDIGRVLCTPRALERLISLYEAGNDLQWGLPFVSGDYVKVPLVDLRARLDNRPLARLKQIVAAQDEYADDLARGKDEAPMEHATVFMAFYKADVAQLTEVRDVCVRLYKLLDRQHRIDLIRQGGERQKFWNAVLHDSVAAI